MRSRLIVLVFLLGGLAACNTASQPGAGEPVASRPVHATGTGETGESEAKDERVVLNDLQLETLTAGLAGVDVTTAALATGGHPFTDANVLTRAVSNELFELAYGVGSTVASGEKPDVTVSTEVFSDGEVVIGTSYDLVFELAGLSRGGTGGFITAVDRDHPRRRSLEMQAEALSFFLGAEARSLERQVALERRALEFLPDKDPSRLSEVVDDGLARLNRRLAEGVEALLIQGAQIDGRSLGRTEQRRSPPPHRAGEGS